MPKLILTGAEFSFKGNVEVELENMALEMDRLARNEKSDQFRTVFNSLIPVVLDYAFKPQQPADASVTGKRPAPKRNRKK